MFCSSQCKRRRNKAWVIHEEVSLSLNKLAQYDKIKVVGLMTMAPHIEDQEK